MRDECFIQNHDEKTLEDIIPCFELRYGNLHSNLLVTSVNINFGEGNRIVFGFVGVNVWLQLIVSFSLEEVYFVQQNF